MVAGASWALTMAQDTTAIAETVACGHARARNSRRPAAPARLHPSAPTARHRPRTRRRGFTLIELMAVMLIIALIASITMASAKFLIHTSRKRRFEVTCLTLETALARYRHEYNVWPVDSPSGSSFTASGENNAAVFDKLREKNNESANPKGIRFLDETTLYTSVRQGTTEERMILSTARAKSGNESRALPLIYREPKSGDTRYFKVTFNFDDDTVDVTKEE